MTRLLFRFLSATLSIALLTGGNQPQARAQGRPTTVALTTTHRPGATQEDRDFLAKFLALLETAVSGRASIQVVERMELDAALHELVLDRSQQVGEPMRLALGKLTAANLIVMTTLGEADPAGHRLAHIRITDSLSGAIRGATVAPADEATIDVAAEEVAGYLSVVVAAPQTAGVRIAVAPFDSVGRFDRLRPLERGLRDLAVANLLRYERFQVLQRSEMKALVEEIDLIRAGLADMGQLPETLPSRRAAYMLRGTVDEKNENGSQQIIVRAELVQADTLKVVDNVEFRSPLEKLPDVLAVNVQQIAAAALTDAGRPAADLAAVADVDEVEALYQAAMRDMHRFWRRKPRDFSHRAFEVPGAAGRGEPRQIVPIDSPLGTALLRKSFDRLESVAYLQPDRQEAAYGLAFCMTCRIEGLWQPERADQILRNIFHRQPDGPFGVAALNLLAEMYYHHEQGTVAPGEAAAARKNILFAFQNMPQAHRDYEWSRLIELLARLRGRDDVEEGAHLMQLVAELAEQPDAPRQNNLAAHAAGAAQSLVLSARQRPELQKEARDLLARWGVSEQKWLRYYALQSLAFVAERENKHTDAAEYYRQAALLMANDANQHDQHLMQIRSARTMREAGDASAALAMIQSFQPHNRAPAALLNGYYGVELGKCLEAVGRKEEALETYVAYAEACANLVDNSDVVQRITALGGAPLNPEREIDVRYIKGPENLAVYHGRSLATDGQRIFVAGDYRPVWKQGVAAYNIHAQAWESIGGPDGRVSSLAYEDGFLWAGTDGQGLWRCHLATGHWTRWGRNEGLPDLAVVAVAPRGRTVFVSVGSRNSGGVVRIDPDDAVHVYESDDAPKVALYHLTVSDDSLYGVNKELYALSLASSAWRREVSPMASPSFGMMSIFKSPSGLWGSTHGREIFRLGATRSQNEKYKASWFPGLGLKAGYAAEFGFEQDGQLWFGGPPWWRFKSSGFYRLDLATGEFVIYGARDGFRPAIPYECYDGLVAGDRFWLATSSGLAEVTVRKELGPKTRSDSD